MFFSAVLPRKVWCGHRDPSCLDKARVKVNREMRKAMVGGLGLFLPHLDIRVEFGHLICLDEIHVSDEGNDVFLKELCLGLCAVLDS